MYDCSLTQCHCLIPGAASSQHINRAPASSSSSAITALHLLHTLSALNFILIQLHPLSSHISKSGLPNLRTYSGPLLNTMDTLYGVDESSTANVPPTLYPGRSPASRDAPCRLSPLVLTIPFIPEASTGSPVPVPTTLSGCGNCPRNANDPDAGIIKGGLCEKCRGVRPQTPPVPNPSPNPR